jgi:ribosomal protein S6--L-glutamate ligase
MRLHFMVVRRVPPVPSPILAEAYEILTRRGYEVEATTAEEVLTRPDLVHPERDLYVLKSHTELSLSLEGVLHTQGARLLNPYRACALTQNKIVVSRLLSQAGVPAPRSWVTQELELLRPLLDETPLIIKPYMGHRGAGISIVRTQDELTGVPAPVAPVIVQELIEGDGEDTKVYVVRDQVFAVRKVFSESSFTQVGRPVLVSDEIRRIALRTGEVCGLALYGLDVIESARGPYVVDVNYFPGYKGVPGIAPLIADCVDDYARGRFSLGEPGERVDVQRRAA